MALNGRGIIDPRWSFFARPVVRGIMLGQGTLYRTVANAVGVLDWNPLAADPADRLPTPSQNYFPIYQGPADIQPALGWRTRKQNWRDETISEGGVQIKLDFAANSLADANINAGVQFPEIVPNDIFKLDAGFILDGVQVDPATTGFTYVVRTISASTNSWSRILMCDIDVGDQSNG